MKDIIGSLLILLGATIFQRGFNMLSGKIKNRFAREMYEKMRPFVKEDRTIISKEAAEKYLRGKR